MQTPDRSSGCGSENHIHAGDPYIQKRLDNAGNQFNTLNINMTKAKQQWEAEMERLNSKYNLDCFSDSELESDEGEQYCYEHGYETLI